MLNFVVALSCRCRWWSCCHRFYCKFCQVSYIYCQNHFMCGSCVNPSGNWYWILSISLIWNGPLILFYNLNIRSILSAWPQL